MLEKARFHGISNVTQVGDRWVGIGRSGDLFVYRINFLRPRWVRLAPQRLQKQQRAA